MAPLIEFLARITVFANTKEDEYKTDNEEIRKGYQPANGSGKRLCL